MIIFNISNDHAIQKSCWKVFENPVGQKMRSPLSKRQFRALCHNFSHLFASRSKNQFFLDVNPSRGSSGIRSQFCRLLVNRSRSSLKEVPELEILLQSKLTERGRHKLRRGSVKEEKGWGLNCVDFNFVCLRPGRSVCVERNAENIRGQRELIKKLALNEVNEIIRVIRKISSSY